MTANRSMLSASATAEASAAADATSRSGRGSTRRSRAGRYPTDAEPVCVREKWLRGRSDVRRAVVPEDGEPAVRVMRASVVGVQRAAVA